MARFDKFWEMKEGGPYEEGQQVFKCTKCGAVSYHPEGWNGEPDCTECSAKCQDEMGDWNPGEKSTEYRRNFDRVFPHAPGANL